MALTEIQKNQNQLILAIIQSAIEDGIRSTNKLDALVSEATKFIEQQEIELREPSKYNDQRHIFFAIDAEHLKLQKLLTQALSNDSQFKAKLQEWATNYKKVTEKINQDVKELAPKLADGIWDGLKKGKDVSQAWGTDDDIRYALRGHISSSDSNIEDKGFYILEPISINNTNHLQEIIEKWRKDHKNIQVNLMIPVNSDSNHWRLANIQLTNGNVTKAELIDSLHNENLKNSTAYKNIKEVVGVEVTVDAKGLQKNDYSCADCTVQEALKQVYPRGRDKNLDPGLAKIRDADTRNATELRDAITDQINNVTLQSLDNTIKAVAKPPKEYDVVLGDELHKVLKNDRSLQMQFDELLATELTKLYDENKNTDQDTEMFNKARKKVYEQLLNTHSIFALKADTSASAATAKDETPSKKVTKS